jgi:outer membrane protein OmpA-like peptidoglycan-associated protein
VKEYLVSRGILASRITTRYHSKSAPVASNATGAGRAPNRRVEIIAQ